MLIAFIVLAVAFLNVLLAYGVVFLIVGYSIQRHEAKKKDLLNLLMSRYIVDDEIPTERFIEEHEKLWEGKTHAPLTLKENVDMRDFFRRALDD